MEKGNTLLNEGGLGGGCEEAISVTLCYFTDYFLHLSTFLKLVSISQIIFF